MSAAQLLAGEFDHEMKVTRSMLERVPFEDASWKPHEKSRAIGALASHIAGLPRLGLVIATQPQFDAAAPGSFTRPEYKTREDLLAAFDENVRKMREALGRLTDEDLDAAFTFRRGDYVLLAGPRARALRTMLMSHLIHHRGQLSVYLRLNDVPLPPVYGPTADT